MDYGQVDRRRHKRIKVDHPIIQSSEFKALNLSESGMRLSCATEYRKGYEITLDLMLGGDPISLKLEVMWCQQASSIYETDYHIGVQFKDHSVGQQLLIRDFIEKAL